MPTVRGAMAHTQPGGQPRMGPITPVHVRPRPNRGSTTPSTARAANDGHALLLNSEHRDAENFEHRADKRSDKLIGMLQKLQGLHRRRRSRPTRATPSRHENELRAMATGCSVRRGTIQTPPHSQQWPTWRVPKSRRSGRAA